MYIRRLKNYFKTNNQDKSDKAIHQKFSYSQSGEDIIVKYIFDAIGINRPTYIDIGAHHPYYLNNTALFYELGCRGINIEPDPSLFVEFLAHRTGDINLNVGISSVNMLQDFYLISIPTLNTFSKESAEGYIKQGDIFIKDVIKVPVKRLDNIISEVYNNIFPDFLNVDTEGLDNIIIDSIDFEQNSPKVICIETISFSMSGKGIKDYDLINKIVQNGYMLYADTNINSIFVKENLWKR